MKSEESIFDQDAVPEGFLDCFLFWAIRFSPSRQNIILPCGFPECKQTAKDIHHESMERLLHECQKFWIGARESIKKSYGRVNWHPQLDSPERHASSSGGDFFWARHGDFWLLSEWPFCLREDFIAHAQKFSPVILESDTEGKLHFVDDPDRVWYKQYKKDTVVLNQ